MKLPLSSYIGPFLRKHNKKFNKLCTPSLFGLRSYIIMMSSVGMIVTLLDIYRVITDGPVLSDKVWNNHSRAENKNVRICPKLERDLKLLTSTITLELYLLLFLGVVTEYPLFYMPWLFVEAVVFVSSVVLSIARLICFGRRAIDIQVFSIGIYAFMVHNWLHTFCLFRQEVTIADL